MSFVKAPVRSSDGVSTDSAHVATAIDGGGFDSPGQAETFATNPSNRIVGSSFTLGARRDRQGMQKGEYVEGHYNPTGYYSYAAKVDYLNPTCYTIFRESVSPEKYGVRYRDIGIGYLGGQSTGLGAPHHVFRRRDTLDSFARIGNMSIVDNDIRRAEVECLVRARNQKWDASEFISGVIPTVMMIADKIRQIMLIRQQLQKGDIVGALTALAINPRSISLKKLRRQSYADNWLGLLYGWLPLLSDIYDGVNLVNKGLNLPDTTFTVKRRVSSELPFTEWQLNGADDPWKDPRLTPKVTSTVDVKYRCRVSDPTLALLTSLGLENPLYLAWVSVPYSFVLDWLSPVSTWLQALTAPLGLQFVNGYRTIHIEGDLSLECGPFGLDPSDQRIVGGTDRAKALISFVEVERTLYSSFPTPQVYFRLPFTIKNSQRVVSTIALLHSQRKG